MNNQNCCDDCPECYQQNSNYDVYYDSYRPPPYNPEIYIEQKNVVDTQQNKYYSYPQYECEQDQCCDQPKIKQCSSDHTCCIIL